MWSYLNHNFIPIQICVCNMAKYLQLNIMLLLNGPSLFFLKKGAGGLVGGEQKSILSLGKNICHIKQKAPLRLNLGSCCSSYC